MGTGIFYLSAATVDNIQIDFATYFTNHTLNGLLLFLNSTFLFLYIINASLKKAVINTIGYLLVFTFASYIIFDVFNYYVEGIPILWIVVTIALAGKSFRQYAANIAKDK